MSSTIIPCLTWVPRGKAIAQPKKVQISKEDLKKAIELTQEKLEEEDEAEEIIEDVEDEENEDINSETIDTVDEKIQVALEAASSVNTPNVKTKKKKHKKGKKDEIEAEVEEDVKYINDINAKYKMEDYDKESSHTVSNPLAGIANLTVYADNNDDPYITLKDGMDSDDEDTEIKDTDNLIVVGQAMENFCSIEKHVYNAELSNLYVHDDFLLPSFPLTIEWLDFDITEDKPGNFVAVGTMEPTIDIWDLDVVNGIEPVATLGQKLKKKKKGETSGHKDAVLGISWNKNAKHVLASASADKTILLWDLTAGCVATTLSKHKDKVQCVKWHPFEQHMLLSGSFDKTVKLFDCRSTEISTQSWAMDGEIEKVLWNHHSPMNFFASTDSGHIYYMDARLDKPLYTMSAHNDAVTGMGLSCEDPSLFVTASSDQIVKVWDISYNRPSVILSSNIQIGAINCLENSPNDPYVFAFGGAKDLKVWDVRDNSDVFSHFCSGEPKVKREQDDDMDNTAKIKIDKGEAMDTDDVAMETNSTETNKVETNSTETIKKNKKKKKKKNNKK